MSPEVAIFAIVAFAVGGFIGSGVVMLAVARDKRVVVLRTGQVVVDKEKLDRLQERVEKIERNPLKHDPRAKVRPPEEDFGDDDDLDDEKEPAPRD